MFLSALLVEKIAPLILDQLTYQLTSRLQNTGDLDGDPLATQLNAIVDRLETGPLKVGLEFLKLGDLQEARFEFVRACVANPHSAVARLCLGILLYNEGQRQQGLANFKQAIEMNPFVSLPPLIQPAQIIAMMNEHLLPDRDGKQENRPFWSWHLQEQAILDTIQPSNDPFTLGHWLPTKGKAQQLVTNKLVKAGPILSVSNSGKHTAIVWQLFEGPDTTPILSVFTQAKKECLWSLRIPNKQLHFASSTYIILSTGNEQENYELFDSETPKLLTTMEKNNYEVTFCPNAKLLPEIDAYKRSNHQMKEKDDVLTEAKFDYRAQATKTTSQNKSSPPQSVYNKEYKDEYILSDPLGLSTNGVKVTNTWEYKNSPAGYHTLSWRTEELHCSPKLNNILRLTK